MYGCPPPWMIPPPPAHSTTIAPPGPAGESGSSTGRLNTGANTFVPKRVTIKTQDGREVDFRNWKKDATPSQVVENNTPSIHQTYQKGTSAVRMETIGTKKEGLAETKKKRLEQLKRLEEEGRKAKEEWKAAEKERRKKAEGGENVVAAPPSALATARPIEDLGHISYPEGVTSPNPELNLNSKKGKFM